MPATWTHTEIKLRKIKEVNKNQKIQLCNLSWRGIQNSCQMEGNKIEDSYQIIM